MAAASLAAAALPSRQSRPLTAPFIEPPQPPRRPLLGRSYVREITRRQRQLAAGVIHEGTHPGWRPKPANPNAGPFEWLD